MRLCQRPGKNFPIRSCLRSKNLTRIFFRSKWSQLFYVLMALRAWKWRIVGFTGLRGSESSLKVTLRRDWLQKPGTFTLAAYYNSPDCRLIQTCMFRRDNRSTNCTVITRPLLPHLTSKTSTFLWPILINNHQFSLPHHSRCDNVKEFWGKKHICIWREAQNNDPIMISQSVCFANGATASAAANWDGSQIPKRFFQLVTYSRISLETSTAIM